MPTLKCPRCKTVLDIGGAAAGSIGTCTSCQQQFMVPPMKSAGATTRPPATPLKPVPAKTSPQEEEVMDVVGAEEEVMDVVSAERDRPRRSRSEDDWDDDDEPRRRKKKRRKPRGEKEPFSLVDLIPMDYALQVNIAVGTALILQLSGVLSHSFLLGTMLILAGLVFFLWGCAAYAKNKGYHELVGLIGIFGLLGLIVLVLMPYRSR